jgi:hypothetical protein
LTEFLSVAAASAAVGLSIAGELRLRASVGAEK